MKLEENGKESSGKRTRHFNIKYFYVTDLIKRKLLKIAYCPSDKLVGDYMSKPTVSEKFWRFRNKIMNILPKVQQECVGGTKVSAVPKIPLVEVMLK